MDYYNPHYRPSRQWAPMKPARSREPQRRRTAVVSYDPVQATNTLEYDDLGTMSDLELPSFQRGNFMRTSLPIVRSASTSLERPLGLVFLVYGDQTKKSLLPNEITTLDTVRALFVRAFTNLTMEMMEETRKKIYLLDKRTNIYFQLEDLAEIKDRCVLKLHDSDNDDPQKVRVRQEVRGHTVQVPLSRARPGHPDSTDYSKAHSLPPQAPQEYQDLMTDQRNHFDQERRSRSRTPEPTERPRSLSAGAATLGSRYSHSPDRLPTPERGLNPIPENRQLIPGYREQGGQGGANFYETIGPSSPAAHRGQYAPGTYEAPPPGTYQSYPNVPSHVPPQQAYITRSSRSATMMHPQRGAMNPIYDTREGARGMNPVRHSPAFAPTPMAPVDPTYQRSQSYRLPPEREQEYTRSLSATPTDNYSKNRIEKMEAQLASLTAWVHYQKGDGPPRQTARGPRSLGSTASDSSDTFPASSASKSCGEITSISTIAQTNHVVTTKGLSDIPDFHRPSVTSSADSTSKGVPSEISGALQRLKTDLHTLKRQQQLNMESMRDEFLTASTKIKTMCSLVPGAENQVYFHKRNDMTEHRKSYIHDKGQVTQELIDLESTVEELRNDVISRKCRVNISDVEGMALLLSNITKNLADLKVRFPELQGRVKNVIDGEMKIVLSEEKFLNEEPVEIEGCLKRCKKLTETLYTLKRLASVQDHRPPHIPSVTSGTDGISDTDQKKMLLENIRSMVPDHDQRVQHMEAADASRERKKKISTQQEALKFGKTLEMASRALRPPSTSDDKPPEAEDNNNDGTDRPKISDVGTVSNDGGHSQVVAGRSKSPVTIKSVSTAQTHPPVYSHPLPPTVSTGVATSVTKTSLVMSQPQTSSFSSTLLAGAKPLERQQEAKKPAAAAVSEEIQQVQSKPSYSQPVSTGGSSRSATLPLTHMTERLSGYVPGGLSTATTTAPTSSEANKQTPTTSNSPVHTVRPSVYSRSNTMGALMRKERTAPLADKEDLVDSVRLRPKSSPVKQPSPSHPPVVSARSFDDNGYIGKKLESNGHVNGHSSSHDEILTSVPTPIYNSSVTNSPSRSSASSSPVRNSTDVSASSMAKVTPGGTINLMLSGTVSPMSPTDPGMFNISPPIEIITVTVPGTEVKPSSVPSTPVRRDSTRSDDSVSLSGGSSSDSTTRQKKVPPPPPPRKGSRPTSVSGMPTLNGGVPHSQQQQESPQFVGGILGQHRLSGGPLSSTPKVSSSQRTLSTFEKDIASGIYANLNRPDLQSQNVSPHQMINQASPNKNQDSHPPSTTVTSNTIDREERGSSSESTSTSGSSGMGSQQSVILRTGSLNVKATKPKPEPPRRQSSLFSKSNPVRDTLVHDRKKTLNGVDL